MNRRDAIKKELKEEQKEFYGEEAVGGHMQGLDTDDNASEALEDFIGIKPSKTLNIEREIEKDKKKD